MRVSLRLLLGLVMVAVVIGAAWALHGWAVSSQLQKPPTTPAADSTPSSAEHAVAQPNAKPPGAEPATEGQSPTHTPTVVPPSCLDMIVLRSEVSATGTSALVKVRVRVRNTGQTPVRMGPGSFWLLDAGESPHLDLTVKERPQAEPLTLEAGQAGLEFAPTFMLSPYALIGSLTLLGGPAITEPTSTFGPQPGSARVLVKEHGRPKGPFLDGVWKSFTATRWQ